MHPYCTFFSLFFRSSAQTCLNHTFTSKRVFTSCKDLQYLNAHLHWTYFESLKLVKIAFRAQHFHNGWMDCLGHYRRGMVGSQALVTFSDSRVEAGCRLSVYTTTFTGHNPSMHSLANSSFTFQSSRKSMQAMR